MTTDNKLTKPAREMLGNEVAPVGKDLAFFNKLSSMPNPDPILRRIGRADVVYSSIMADAHVKGDIRSIRGDFRSQFYRINAGDETDKRSQDARDLCEWWLEHSRPNVVAQDWLEVMWQMLCAAFYGYRVHEVVWDYVGGQVLPIMIKDRANKRFAFDADGALLLKTTENPNGVPVEPYQFVVSRHMATCENPYGDALLSSCFWPWTFKTGGFKFFMQYCEKYGVPTPVGKYPMGADAKDRQSMEDALANVLNNGYMMVPVGAEVDLLTATGGGHLPQEALINLCNREMSKALTSQAMVSEQQGTGARAASETAAARQALVNNADHDIASMSFSEIFRWITVFNFGHDVAPPTLEFMTEQQATLERVQTYKAVADMGGRPSLRALLEEANIPAADDDADAILPTNKQPAVTGQAKDEASFASADFAESVDAEAALSLSAAAAFDKQFEASVIQPFADMLDEFIAAGKDLAEFQESLGALLQGIDSAELQAITEQALTLSALNGAAAHKVVL
jgi:phage gp29-like protein